MHRSQHRHSGRIQTCVITAAAIVGAIAMIGSCVLETRTNFCAQFGVRCREGQECAATEAVCIDIGGCGNRVIDEGELCDDGNTRNGELDESGMLVLDQCSDDCQSTQECGNAVMDEGEACDDGTLNGDPSGTCDFQCRLVSRVCGNGELDREQGERCDPGPMDSEDCNSSMAGALGCRAARCGDGYPNKEAREQCDTIEDTAECNASFCTTPRCGDNYTNRMAGEQCDDDGEDTQICNGEGADLASCRFASCGDGYVNDRFTPPGAREVEACDNPGGGDTSECNGNNQGDNGRGSCRAPECGDNYKNIATEEDCDNGDNDSVTCNGSSANAASCKEARCGDGYINGTAGEVCEPPRGLDTRDCNGASAGLVACHTSLCGDRYPNLQDGEDCDVGRADGVLCNGSDASRTEVRCKSARCGDRYVNREAGEDCDPGTGNDEEACNGRNAGPASCNPPRCGDGHTNEEADEECDNLGGDDTPTCNGQGAGDVKCQDVACGDGYINQAADEECENDDNCDSGEECTSCRCQ
jgi:hypothetical protein